MLSATKEIEPGARAMLLAADGLFRLDVAIVGDTIRTTVRNFSTGELEMGRGQGGYGVGEPPGRARQSGPPVGFGPADTDQR